jgi:hypothetical protein
MSRHSQDSGSWQSGPEINHTYIIAQENWVKGRCIGNWSFTIGAVRGRLAAFCRDLH